MAYRTRHLLGLASAFGALVFVIGCGKPSEANKAEEAASAQQAPEVSSGASQQPVGQDQVRALPDRVQPFDETRFRNAEDGASALPPIRVVPPTLNWGTVAPSAVTTGSVQLQNISDKPVKILTVQPSCKCTTSKDLEGAVIPPGGSVELDAELEAQASPGPRTVQIRVLFEGYSQVVTIPAKADISRHVRVRPPYINAVEGKNATGVLMVNSVDGTPFTILGVQGQPPQFSRSTDDGPKSSYILNYDIENFLQIDGRYPRYVVIETDRDDCPLVEVMLRHEQSMLQLSPIFKPRSYQMNLGRTAPGGSVSFDLGVRESTTTGPLVAAMVEEPGISAEIADQSIDDATDDLNAKIIFTVAADKPEGFYYFPVRLYASNQAEMAIPAFISVRSSSASSP